jgi:hypothetical protein
MRSRCWFWWLSLLLLPLMACESSRVSARAKTTKPGLMVESDAPSSPPASGYTSFGETTFGNEKSEGEARGRTENHFDPSRWATDDLTNGLQPAQGGAKAPVERLLAYQGEIRVEVARPDDAMAQFVAKAKEWGGYLQNQTGSTVTVRIPAKNFEAAFVLLRGFGRVLNETRKADDVTEEFTDLGIRIDNARKSRDRLLEVLQKAEKVEDVLKVETELRRLTEEIERMEGRRKFLAEQVTMSVVRATFQAVAEAPPVRRSRQMSRFAWINAIGAERVMEDF